MPFGRALHLKSEEADRGACGDCERGAFGFDVQGNIGSGLIQHCMDIKGSGISSYYPSRTYTHEDEVALSENSVIIKVYEVPSRRIHVDYGIKRRGEARDVAEGISN